MNTVIRTLKEHIADPDISFVFPSQTAAGLWARKTCTLGIVRSVASNRFLAWDRFKEEFIQRETGREPASNVIRKLFADALIRKNAEKLHEKTEGGLPFTSLIPPEYALNGGNFVSLIAGLLPSLAQWEKMMKHAKIHLPDAEDRDLALVKKEYTVFLERHRLFEPSWEEIIINKESTRYVIFFPELIEDFAEYEGLLKAPRFICIEEKNSAARASHSLVFYQSAREEIRSAVTEIRRLHEEEDISYEEIAVSVPDLEILEPVLLKEFSLRHVPVTRRAGKNLGETGAGKLFTLINECASSQFSFNSLKALILNDHIPWKEKEKNKALIKYGIKYNCVSSYTEDGKVKDIWEEAFRTVKNSDEKVLRTYYMKLKECILSLVNSKRLNNIRKNYFAFKGSPSAGFLDMEKITEEDDAVLSRCIEELNSLIELEEKLDDPELIPASPFGFFLSCLKEKEYVKAGQKSGVNIFRWRVATASPFVCHFVLNASQSAASVLYQPMKFLRQDKRKLLGIEDRDATEAFFLLLDTGEDEGYRCRIRISASTQTFSGWAIPHSFFAQGKTIPHRAGSPDDSVDPYQEERRFWRGLWRGQQTSGEKPDNGKAARAELKKIFPMQKSSYTHWKNTLAEKKKSFSFFKSPVFASIPAGKFLKDTILGKDRFLTVTPTNDLNVFFGCTLKWLFARVFKAKEFAAEAALLDDTSLGILYHKILEDVFSRIKEGGGIFDSGCLDIYKSWASEATKAVIEEHPAFSGPLAIPLVSPQAEGITKKIAALMELEAKFFDGYKVADLELKTSLKTEELHIEGIIDRVSVSPDGEPVIIDYKTKYLPDQTDMEKLEETPLTEFQMPLYIKLYEEMAATKEDKDSAKVKGACFYSINDRRVKSVMGGNKAPTREEYTPFLEAAENQIREFSEKVKALDFIPREIRIKNCMACLYKPACRSAYFLNTEN